jgi:hypothetical protein
MNVRMLSAIVTLGHLRRGDEIGGWSAGVATMSWRTPSAGRRNLLINATEDLFAFPTLTLLAHRDQVLRKSGTGNATTHIESADIPDMAALDPLSDLPPNPGPARPCRVVFADGASMKRWSASIQIGSARWWWGDRLPYGAAVKAEYNPGNTINTQQGVECFYPIGGKSRTAAIATLAVARPNCSEFSGSPGDGICSVAPSSEKCMAAGKSVVWPRVVLTNPAATHEWGVAPDGFEALRRHVGTNTFGGFREDLAVIAGACKALREGQDFRNGTIVTDESWLRSQLSDDAWEALRK